MFCHFIQNYEKKENFDFVETNNKQVQVVTAVAI